MDDRVAPRKCSIEHTRILQVTGDHVGTQPGYPCRPVEAVYERAMAEPVLQLEFLAEPRANKSARAGDQYALVRHSVPKPASTQGCGIGWRTEYAISIVLNGAIVPSAGVIGG